MTLFLDNDVVYFRPLRGSPYLFCSYSQYLIYRPWLSIELRFGSQVCYSGRASMSGNGERSFTPRSAA